MSSLQGLWSLCGGFALTYLIHSTCVLSICWLATLVVNRHFYAFHSLAWRCATLLGLATASIALVSNSAIDMGPGWSLVAERQDLQSAVITAEVPEEVALSTDSIDSTLTVSAQLHSQTHENIAKESDVISVDVAGPAFGNKNTQDAARSRIKAETEAFSAVRQSPPLLLTTVAGIALTLCVLGMIRFVLRWNSYRCLMQSCRPCSHRIDRMLRRVQQHCPRRCVTKILISTRIAQPFATGVLRWKIVLPSGLDTQLSDEELYALLAHELGHLARGDLIWQWIGELVCNCLAFQPLNFVARRKWQCASEFLADRWSLENGHASPMALAKCLTRVAEWISEKEKVVPLSTTFSEKNGTQLIARVSQLFRLAPTTSSKRSYAWIARMASAGTFAVICPLAGFAPHCIPNPAMGVEVNASSLASQARMQWSDAELELQSLQADLERLVNILPKQRRSPIVSQVIKDLEFRTTLMSQRASTISRKFHSKETQ